MGEYAYRTDGQHVKIGTCEDMWYLRFDQLDQIARADKNSLDPRDPEIWEVLRFRFPFPNEDCIQAGEFDDSDHGVTVPDLDIPAGVDHHRVQFISNPIGGSRGGYNVMLPCPSSTRAEVLAEAAGVQMRRNGGLAGVTIVQQAVRGGVLVLVARCAACGATYRYPDRETVQPVLNQIDKIATAYATSTFPPERDEQRATWWRSIADRIRAGYEHQLTA